MTKLNDALELYAREGDVDTLIRTLVQLDPALTFDARFTTLQEQYRALHLENDPKWNRLVGASLVAYGLERFLINGSDLCIETHGQAINLYRTGEDYAVSYATDQDFISLFDKDKLLAAVEFFFHLYRARGFKYDLNS
jgi:hypothetical protein